MSLLIYRLFVWQTILYRAKMNSDANDPINSKSSFGVNIMLAPPRVGYVQPKTIANSNCQSFNYAVNA